MLVVLHAILFKGKEVVVFIFSFNEKKMHRERSHRVTSSIFLADMLDSSVGRPEDSKRSDGRGECKRTLAAKGGVENKLPALTSGKSAKSEIPRAMRP